jgi:DNA-binding transcriptional LysR family regulator
MELRHLRYFVAVAEELHFGHAAERLYITQPPLSLQIRSLERELGVDLFVRGRHIELTEAGRALLEKARHTLEAADAAVRAAQEAGKAGGRLRVGLPATGGMDLAPAAVRSFRERFPHVGVELLVAHTGAHLRALEAERVDLAFVRGRVPDGNGTLFRVLDSEGLVLAMAEDHALARARPVPVERLAGEPIILLPALLEPPLHHLVIGLLARLGIAPSVALEATTVESTYDAVAAKLGVAFVTESTARLMAARGVVHHPFTPASPRLKLGVAWRREAALDLVGSFLAVLDEFSGAPACPPGALDDVGSAGRVRVGCRGVPASPQQPIGSE